MLRSFPHVYGSRSSFLVLRVPARRGNRCGASRERADRTSSQLSTLLEQQTSWKFECSGNHCILNGDVELPLPGNQGKFFADQIELFGDKDLLVASGNVVFATRKVALPPRGRSSTSRSRPARFTSRPARCRLGLPPIRGSSATSERTLLLGRDHRKTG